MSVTYADELTACYCPVCYAIPCRCSCLTRLLEWSIRQLNRYRQHRYHTRQLVLRHGLSTKKNF